MFPAGLMKKKKKKSKEEFLLGTGWKLWTYWIPEWTTYPERDAP